MPRRNESFNSLMLCSMMVRPPSKHMKLWVVEHVTPCRQPTSSAALRTSTTSEILPLQWQMNTPMRVSLSPFPDRLPRSSLSSTVSSPKMKKSDGANMFSGRLRRRASKGYPRKRDIVEA